MSGTLSRTPENIAAQPRHVVLSGADGLAVPGCELSFKLSLIFLDDVITAELAQASSVRCLKTLERISSNPWTVPAVKPFCHDEPNSYL
jgi:hypothetical protein